MSKFDTIAAIATGNAVSAIGIVRVSGPEALTAADKIFTVSNGTKSAQQLKSVQHTKSAQRTLIKDAQDRHMYYGALKNTKGELIDLCLCMISRAPNSYTGEDTVEFHCHGSPVVLSEVLEALFAQGVRQAQAGEFTKRAFLNGRMDLTQAEAVIDLIEAETPYAAKNAAEQLAGAVSSKLNTIYSRLVDIMAHFHAVVDYPDEDIEEFEAENYLTVLRESGEKLRRLLSTHERGKVLRNGIPTAIVGRTNVGKSSLFNALLGFERAIVTDIAGTTRDTIEEKVLIGSVLLRLIDTAGLRKTDDTIEKLGVERTLASLDNAQLILAVLDGSQPLCEEDYKVLNTVASKAPGVPCIVITNKSDLPQVLSGQPGTVSGLQLPTPKLQVSLSAKTGEGIPQLCREIQKLFPDFDTAPAGEVITGARQAEAIGRAAECLTCAAAALTDKVSPDAVLMDIESAMAAIGEVTGKTMREDIISRIFDRFCVGK